MKLNPGVNYLDEDVSYLLGMLVARGELMTGGNVYSMVIHFPKGSLIADGLTKHFDIDKETRLGIEKIRERIKEVLGTDDIRTVYDDTLDLVIRFHHKTMAWRNIQMLLGDATGYQYSSVPAVFLDSDTPTEYKREFLRGYADVAGNIRPANSDRAGRHRVRLDTLNYLGNWSLPVQLCVLLQEHLSVAVPCVIWGHPNLGRHWKEHQLDVYAEDFAQVGFYFDYKQEALEELAEYNQTSFSTPVKGCPGARRAGKKKASDPEEKNAERLPPELLGKHFNAYWHICKALGCSRKPTPGEQLELPIEDD